mgnify:CR=1 FL=1
MSLGNKANCLKELVKLGINVPKFAVIPAEMIKPALKDKEAFKKYILQILEDNFDYYDLISIRSSPVYSMPGMMDTILNVPISLNIQIVADHILNVYNSYYNVRAIKYREIKGLPDEPPSVILQKMVFGDKNDESGSGIMFTHNLVGQDIPLIEYKKKCQGDKLVNNQINHIDFINPPNKICEELEEVRRVVLKHFRYPQDLEFTVEDNVLYILQTRRLWFGNRLDYEICNALYKDGIITKDEFISDINIIFKNKEFRYIEHANTDPIAKGVGVVGGIVEGTIGEDILFENVLGNDDIEKLRNYKGVVTDEGGLTSHIAIICRNLNIPYIICKEDISGYVIMDGYSGNFYEKDSVTIINLTKEKVCAALMDL